MRIIRSMTGIHAATDKKEKDYLVSWKDRRGYSHNGTFSASSLKELREICQAALPTGTKITDIDVISDQVEATEEIDDGSEFSDIKEIGQEFTSKNTSINFTKTPAVFKLVHDWEPGTVNLDYGGGRADTAADYLTQYDVINLVYDPFNRSKEHNREVIRLIREHGGADTATLSNVLNVIKEPEVRLNVLENLSKLVKPDGTVYITVYEGDGSGEECPTRAGYQLNRKTRDYLEEIQEVFPEAFAKGKLIIADNR